MRFFHAAALDKQLADLLASIGPVLFYLVVFGLVFAGTAFLLGVFLPFITGDSLLFGAGIVSASALGINIWILAIGVGLFAFLGDQVGFLLGRHYGRPYLDKRGGRRTTAMIIRTEKFYTTYGWWSVVIARFIPWGRVFVPVIAGFGRMNYFRFLSSNLVGALAWAVGLTVIGYFAASIPSVKVLSYVIAGIFITASIIAGIRAWRADRKSQLTDTPSTP